MKASSSSQWLQRTKKTVIVDTEKGLDQLGNEIGMPRPGDVVKCHMKASYIAPMRPPWGFGKKTPRKKEFLDTARIGETCFYEVRIPPTVPPTIATKAEDHKSKTTARDIITEWIRTMTLGQVAKFELDLNQLQDEYPEVKRIFVTKTSSSTRPLLHRSQYAHVPETIQQVIFEISSFRIIRKQREHRRKEQNGRLPAASIF